MTDKMTDRCRQYLAELEKVPLLADAVGRTAGREDIRGKVNRLVLGPVIHGYVLWLLSSAVKDGIQRLYFLARDGYLPYRIAQEICRELDLPVECRYFYCSRAALRVPMYHRDIPGALDHICRGGMNVTPERILLRAGLDPERAGELFPQLVLPWDWDEVIPYARLGEVRELLGKNEIFLEAMCNASSKVFPAIHGFFRQSGILEPGRFAIVDSGWTGTMQRSIRDICEACAGRAELTGYYFGLYHLPEGSNRDRYSSFFFSPEQGLWNKVQFNNNLFEVVFSAPHGTCMGYRMNGGIAEAVLGEPRAEIVGYIRDFEGQMTELTCALLKDLTSSKIAKISIEPLQAMNLGLLRRFMCNPTPQEAEAFGTLPFSDELQDAGIRELAERLTGRELWRNHALPRILGLLGLGSGEPRQSGWFEGSAIRHGRFRLWHLWSYRFYKLLLYLRRR